MSICFDCRMWLYWRERQRYFAETGEDHGLGYVRMASGLRADLARVEAEAISTAVHGRNTLAELELEDLVVARLGQCDVEPVARIDRDQVFDDGRLRTFLEAEKATNLMFAREREDIEAIAGPLLSEFDQRYEQAVFLQELRRMLAAYFKARMNVAEGLTRGKTRVQPSIRVSCASATVRAGPISEPK